MTRAEAAAYFERVGCPATQARDEVFSFVDRDYGDVDLEGVAAAAADAIRAYRRAAARLADPPRPWPQFLAGNVADLRAELVLGASQLEPIVTVRNQVDLAEAWSRMAELPTRLSVRSVRLLLRWSPRDTDRPGCRR